MGAASITAGQLLSRAVRSQIGSNGIRRISYNPSPQQSNQGFLGAIVSFAKNLGNFLVQAISNVLGAFSFTVTAIVGLFFSAVNFIWNFDWNITDKSIDQKIQNGFNQLGSVFGAAVGGTFGWLACGILPGTVIMAFNEAMGLHVLKEVGDQMLEEVAGYITSVVKSTFRFAAQAILLTAYKSVRKWLKNPNNPILNAVFGNKADDIKKAWGAEGSKPWSFAGQLNEKIESIDNQFLQNFVEEAFEEGIESCVEAGYAAANSVDNYLAMMALQNKAQGGKEKTVVIQPDRSNDKEKITLKGRYQDIKTATTQILGTYQLLDNRDVGVIVGSPVEEFVRAKPQTIQLVLIFYSVKQPPWRKSTANAKFVQATYTIPNVKKSKCEWQLIKNACGGENGYEWGRFRCTINLDNGRQMALYAGSEAEAEQRMTAFLELTEAKMLTMSITEEKKKGRRLDEPKLYKENTRIYPAFCTILNKQLVSTAAQGKPELSGIYNKKETRIPLWHENKPPEFDDIINNLFKTPGQN